MIFIKASPREEETAGRYEKNIFISYCLRLISRPDRSTYLFLWIIIMRREFSEFEFLLNAVRVYRIRMMR